MSKLIDGCVKPVKGPIIGDAVPEKDLGSGVIQEVKKVLAKVGKEAIDFEALLNGLFSA